MWVGVNYALAHTGEAMKQFICYSFRLKRALLAAGFKPVCLMYNPNRKSFFYVFEMTEKLEMFKSAIYQSVRDNY